MRPGAGLGDDRRSSRRPPDADGHRHPPRHRRRLARPRRAARARGRRRRRSRRPAGARGAAARARRSSALDTETSSLEPHDAELIGLSLAASPTEVWYLPFGHRPRGGELAAPAPVRNLPPITDFALAPLVALLEDPAVPKAGHNIKYDWQVLRRAGVELAGVAFDSMLASFVLDPGRRSHAIDTLCLEHFGRAAADLRRRHRAGQGADPVRRGARSRRRRRTAARTARRCSRCTSCFAPALARHRRWSRCSATSSCRWSRVLTDMEWDGIAIDPRGLRAAQRAS